MANDIYKGDIARVFFEFENSSKKITRIPAQNKQALFLQLVKCKENKQMGIMPLMLRKRNYDGPDHINMLVYNYYKHQ